MKTTIISIIIGLALVGGVVVLSNRAESTINNGNNVMLLNGQQIIEVRAKGGYSPRKSSAKAGIPTILRFNTSGTFDCSSSVRIASLNVSKNLPPSGTADIDLGNPRAGVLKGTCGMGMYPFEIDFES